MIKKLALISILLLLTAGCTISTEQAGIEAPLALETAEKYACQIDTTCGICNCSAAQDECVNRDWWQANEGQMKDCICDPNSCTCLENKCTKK